MAENKIVPFDYSAVPTELSDYLRTAENRLRNEYMNFTANCGRIFAEAQEKFANNKNGMFEQWFKSIGFSKTTVYNLINVYKLISFNALDDMQLRFFESLPKNLQYEIARPSAPPELVEQVLDGDITTRKEYVALRNTLNEKELALKRMKADLDEAMADIEEYVRQNEDDVETIKRLRYDISELEQQVTELENRPIEVAVTESGSVAEAERRFNETIRRLDRQMIEIKEEADKEIFEMRTERNAALDRAEAAEKALEKAVCPPRYCVILTKFEFDALKKIAKGTPCEGAVMNGKVM